MKSATNQFIEDAIAGGCTASSRREERFREEVQKDEAISHILLDLDLARCQQPRELAERNGKESLIAQIVERTTGNRRELAKLIAVWANRYKVSEMDLHALLKKADDPAIRSYTPFVRWP